jgi:hypothetical protein
MRTHSKLPIRITLLLWLVLIITAWNTVRFATSIGWHDTLETYAPWPGPLYIGITGAVWAVAGLFLFMSFVRRARWTRIAFLIAGSIYSIWVWVDKLFVQAQLRANWPFDLLATLVLVGFTTAVVLDPHNQIYFLKRDL